jgi:Protein of unknown function (DUF1580)
MPIIVVEESVFPLAELPDHLPLKNGKKVHRSIGFRWRHGLRGVCLETVRCGGALHTSVEALQRFFDRLSALDATTTTAVTGTIPAGRRKAVERAEQELASLGI